MLFNFMLWIASISVTMFVIEIYYPLYIETFGMNSYVVVVFIISTILFFILFDMANPTKERKENEFNASKDE